MTYSHRKIKNECARLHLLGYKPYIHIRENRVDIRRENSHLFRKYYKETIRDLKAGLIFKPKWYHIIWRKIVAVFQTLAYFIVSFINDN